MALFLFWLKIAARRIVSFAKQSPVVIIGTAVIVAAFFVGRNDIERTMDIQTEVVALSFFVFVSLLLSIRNYPTMPSLMIYAKSGLRNKYIRFWFFVKKALANNALFLLFGIASLTGIVRPEYPVAVPAAIILSLLLSLAVMYLKNGYSDKKLNKITVKKTRLSPVIKSTICDYFSSEFLQTTVISIGLFAAVMVLLIGNIRFLHELENPSILFIGITIVLSLGFMGIIESVPHMNWKFHAIVFPQEFPWHIKRTILFLGVFFGLQIILFAFTAVFFGLPLMLKYLYCILVVSFLSIHIAFMVSGRLVKAITLLLAVAFTLWISTLQTAFLLVLPVPVLLTFFRANGEYREWYYL